MAEYIEREALIQKMRVMPIPEQAKHATFWLDSCAAGVNSAIKTVANFPAADVVEVVRCKDCKHHCNGTCGIVQGKLKPDDFCSYGERRADHGTAQV